MCPALTQRHARDTKWVLSPIPRGSSIPYATIFLKKETMCSRVLGLSPQTLSASCPPAEPGRQPPGREPCQPPHSRGESGDTGDTGSWGNWGRGELGDTRSWGTQGVRGPRESGGCGESGDKGSRGTRGIEGHGELGNTGC